MTVSNCPGVEFTPTKHSANIYVPSNVQTDVSLNFVAIDLIWVTESPAKTAVSFDPPLSAAIAMQQFHITLHCTHGALVVLLEMFSTSDHALQMSWTKRRNEKWIWTSSAGNKWVGEFGKIPYTVSTQHLISN